MYDVVIVGGGPAGLSAALTAKHEELDYLLLEKNKILSTFEKYHPEKPVMTYPCDKSVKGPLPFEKMKTKELVEKWKKLTDELNVRLEEAIDIKQENTTYIIKTTGGEYKSKNVVLAIGIQGTPRRLGVPGEYQKNVYHNQTPCLDFSNKTVVVVGGGDTALETALIAESEGADVIISYRKPAFFRPHKENIDKIAKSKIKTIFNSHIVKIDGNKLILNTNEGEKPIKFDCLVICIGTVWPEGFLKKIGITVERKNAFTDKAIEVQPGLLVAGDLVGRPSIKMAINQGFDAIKKIKNRTSHT
ncbi:MAG: NAD(P)/FAD-dependent oxidoreductase [Candidatus Diapherotrites archaeon]|nr:NAD(P)/FAD-dependent oxidoreductase [Candidatus Diapherotrites archaeon]